ncbi:MAG: EAL domain-containing protein [Syntrophales bacterium]|jgi:diguanylate cyclase (GGDEF)-like protein/PAS domain S-box-containing protein|nr:EAL domain-containing protein [Syntrophales bacterium]
MKTQTQPLLIVQFRMLRILMISLLCAGFAFQSPLSPAFAEKSPDEIVAGVHRNYPPQYSIDEKTGKPEGFAIDTMDEIAKGAGLKVRYILFDEWPPIERALKEGRIDVIPNIGVVEARKTGMDFTSPLETYNISIFVRSTTTDIQGIDDLQGRKVAVVTYNIGLSLIQEYGKAKPVISQSLDEALLSLLSGNTDALVYPEPPVLLVVRKSQIEERIKTVGNPLIEVKRAIAVGKGKTELLNKLDKEVNAFVATPAYAKIYARWYGTPEPYWDARRVLILAGVVLALVIVILAVWRYLSLMRLNRDLKYSLEEQKKAEKALSNSKGLLHTLVQTIPDLIWLKDKDGVYLSCNSMFERFFGAGEADIVGKTDYDFVDRELADSFREHDRKAMAAGRPTSNEEWLTFADDGHRALTDTIKTPMYDAGGTLLGVLGIGRDITERKRAEEELRENQARLDLALRSAGMGVWRFDIIENKRYFDDQVCHFLGINPATFTGAAEEFYGAVHPDDRETIKAALARTIEQDVLYEPEYRAVWPDGSVHYITARGRLIRDDKGLPLRINGVVWDVADRKRAEEKLRLSEERFRRIFDEGPFGLVLANPDYTIVTANKAFCGLLGYSEQDLTGQNLINLTCEEDREESREISRQLFAGGIPVSRSEKRYVRKDGGIVWAKLTISPIHGNEGHVLYTLAIIEDLTEIRKSADKIHRLAYYDSLTGLPNRVFLKDLLKGSINHAQRRKELFALIYIGLDNFQRINDTLGHISGDLLLKAVADRLTNSLRKSDYVARSDGSETVNVVSRMGGDEFIVLAHDLNQPQDAARTSRRLLEEISAPYDLSGREVFITVSIGISLYPDDGTDIDDLLKNAEKAMRHTKSEGKNNYHFYSASMHSSVLELLTLESDLHKALERGELVLYYQPKVDAATRMVKGMEALIRWKHPDRGLIPPLQFIPLAEASGLIIPIGEFVIRTVCGQIKTWQEAGCQRINIALNLSSRQFDQPNLIEIVKEALQGTLISPQCLELEITESVIMRNPEKAIRTLTELKALGIQIAIDDFGTGYSSLSYLKRLPLDFLKIDQSFVQNLASDPSDQAIIRAIIAMAHSLNLKTIAEGVETEEQLSFLQEHGCDEIQGYLFSRPLPAEEIPGILRKPRL